MSDKEAEKKAKVKEALERIKRLSEMSWFDRFKHDGFYDKSKRDKGVA